MMKRRANLICLLAFMVKATVLFAAPPQSEIISYPIYKPETVADSRCVSLSNDLNRYVLKFIEFHPGGRNPGSFEIRLREPSVYYSFSRPISDFINLQVDSLPMRKLSPDFKAMTLFQDEQQAGVTMPLNFGGKRILLHFYVRSGSPFLFGRIENPSGKELGCVQVVFKACISKFAGHKPVYQRQAQSAARQLSQQPEPQNLQPDDQYLILADEKIQPPADPDAVGPCLLQWSHAEVQKGTLKLQNQYQTRIEFELKSAFQKFEFALLESKRPRSNQEFYNYAKEFLKPFP
jgi:hypothetical protein